MIVLYGKGENDYEKLKEREAGINQCLKGRMKVRVITKVINNRTLEGYVLEVEDENFHPVVYEEKNGKI